MKVNWATGVALVYSAFALSTSAFVTFAMSRSVDLVRADYYAESLRHDDRLEAIDNATRLGSAAAIVAQARSVEIALPPSQRATARGTITLYRPSSASADRHIDLAIDAGGRQRVAMDDAARGLWIVQLAWSAGGRDFYLERPITIP
jgi:hypothetical protein